MNPTLRPVFQSNPAPCLCIALSHHLASDWIARLSSSPETNQTGTKTHPALFQCCWIRLDCPFFLGADSCVGCHGSVAGHHGLCGKWRGCQYLYPAIFHLNGSERYFIFNGEYQRGCNRLPSDKNSHPQPVSYEYLSIFGDSSVSFYRDFYSVSIWQCVNLDHRLAGTGRNYRLLAGY